MSIETALSILKETIANREIKYYMRTTYDENGNRLTTVYISEYYSKAYSNCVPIAEFKQEWKAEKAINELYRLHNDITEVAITEIVQRYNGQYLHNFNQFWKRFQQPIELLKKQEVNSDGRLYK